MRIALLAPALLIAASASAANEVIFEGFTLQGLTTVTDDSALADFGTSKAPAIASITDANWTTDGINSMGQSGGVLAGEFGMTFTSAGKYLFVIAPAYTPNMVDGHTIHMGTFALSILLANDQYVSAGTFGDSDFTLTTSIVSGNYYGSANSVTPFPSDGNVVAQYLSISLGALDTQSIGVKGIKFENFTGQRLDLNYIGITGGGAVPEPSTYGLALGGLALAVVAMRRRKSSK